MSIKIEGDDITFSSGRVAYAHNGIVGLSPELEIFQGYDGYIFLRRDDGGDLSGDDMRELADFMIAQWQRFKDARSAGDKT